VSSTSCACRILIRLKNIQISNNMKIRPAGAKYMQTDRQDAANSRFSQNCEKRFKSRFNTEFCTSIALEIRSPLFTVT
jgi:hypothetical protein